MKNIKEFTLVSPINNSLYKTDSEELAIALVVKGWALK